MTVAAADEIKACCAATYASPVARFLLGDSYHPGGAALTRELLDALEVDGSATVLDVASGPGASAILAARELGCAVVGVELAPENVAAATEAAAAADLSGRIRFVQGDAERLPLADESVDGTLCECAFCLFPDKSAAASELARVLRPGARLALSDVVADVRALPTELAGLAGWVSCIADARPLSEVAALLESAGLRIERAEELPGALETTIDRIEGRLRLARMLRDATAPGIAAAVERGLALVPLAREAVASGALGYGVLLARR